jgi:hypothetical protein
MTGSVIQGFFVGGRPRVAASVVLLTATPRLPATPVPGFADRQAPAQPKVGARPPGSPIPARPARPPMAQAHGSTDSFHVDPGRLGLASGGGRTLPDAVRGKMEAALGADFSGVRVHVGPQAERIGAIAFTLGSDIYFAPGRFQPETPHGQQLLGHELAHVVQQRQGRVRNPIGSGVAVVQDLALEAEADRLGRQAAGHPVAIQARLAPLHKQPTIQQARRGWRLLNQYGFTAGPARPQGPAAAHMGAIPAALNLGDATQWPALPGYPAEGAQTIAAGRKLPQQQQAEPIVKPQQQDLAVKALAQHADMQVPKPQPQTKMTPADRMKQKTGTQPAQQPTPRKLKKTYQPMEIGSPNVGSWVNTIAVNNHATFRSIVVLTLNNDPDYNQLHLHRDANRIVVQISKKHTTTQGNGPSVPLGSAMGQQAIQKGGPTSPY